MSQHEARVPRFARATLTSADGTTAAVNVQAITIEQDGAYFQIVAGNGGFEIRQHDTRETTGMALLPSSSKSVVVETRWNDTYAKARRLEAIRDHRLACDDCGADLAWHSDTLVHVGTQSEYSVYPVPHIATAPSPTSTHPPIPAV